MKLRPSSSPGRGVFISVDGPSGAGKSTTVRQRRRSGLQPLTQPILDTRTASRRMTPLGRDVDVHVNYEWVAPMLVMRRRWEYGGGAARRWFRASR